MSIYIKEADYRELKEANLEELLFLAMFWNKLQDMGHANNTDWNGWDFLKTSNNDILIFKERQKDFIHSFCGGWIELYVEAINAFYDKDRINKEVNKMKRKTYYYISKGKINSAGCGDADRCSELFTDIEKAKDKFAKVVEYERATLKDWRLSDNEHVEVWLEKEVRDYKDDEEYDIVEYEVIDWVSIYDKEDGASND